MDFTNKRVVVFGANSFAGGCFVQQSLASGLQVLGVNRSREQNTCMTPYKLSSDNLSNYNFHQLDINNDFVEICQLIDQFQPHYIVDYAGQGMVAESWVTPEQWYQTNVVAKVRLLSFLKDKSYLKRYVRASTPEVYGSTKQLIDENAYFNPTTPYAVSHAAIDMHITALVKQYNFPAIITRFSNFYGPTQQLYRIIPRTIIYAKMGKQLSLHGGGLAVRAFIYGDDAAQAILSCLSKGKTGETYHFSTDQFISIKSLVQLICENMNINFNDFVITTDDRPGKDSQYLMSDEKAKSELDWFPKISLAAGIANTLHWVEENWQEIINQPLEYIHKA